VHRAPPENIQVVRVRPIGEQGAVVVLSVAVALLGTLPAIIALLLARRVGQDPSIRSIEPVSVRVPAPRDVHCTVGCATTTLALFIDARGATRTDSVTAVQQVTLQAGHANQEPFGAVLHMRVDMRALNPLSTRGAS
jgi:hypothetical protein